MHDDESGCSGLFTLLIVGAMIAWLSDNWKTILLVVVGIIAIVVIIAAIKSHNNKVLAQKAAAKVRAAKEAEEKRKKEEASYRNYVEAQQGSGARVKLKAANEILERLFRETDPDNRTKILAFFDKYLPLMTEIIEASKHGEGDIDDSVKRFTETVKSFSKSLYKVDDVIDANKTVMESMAIRDGLYDPYAEEFNLDTDASTGEREIQ